MKHSRSLINILCGIALGVAAVLSCSDGSPKHADATTCDCPASEAPIAGRLVAIDSPPTTIDPGKLGATGIACSPGMQFLSGGCTNISPTTVEDITVVQFGFDKTTFGWICNFKNNKGIPVQVK